jgi:hypothetical protein
MEPSNEVKSFSVKDLRQGNDLNKTMKSGVLVINGVEIPFVLRRRSWGKIEISVKLFRLSVVHFADSKKTAFTKAGYVSFLLTSEVSQFWIYVKNEDVSKLTSAIAIVNV